MLIIAKPKTDLHIKFQCESSDSKEIILLSHVIQALNMIGSSHFVS